MAAARKSHGDGSGTPALVEVLLLHRHHTHAESHGDGSGTPALVEVLLLHRHQTHTDVVAGITAALTVGAVSLDFVAVKTRKHALQHANPTPADPVVVILGRTPTAEVTEALLLDLRPAAVRLRLRQPAHRNEGRMTTNATTTS